MLQVDITKLNGKSLKEISDVVKHYYDKIKENEVSFINYNTRTKYAMNHFLKTINYEKHGKMNMGFEIIFE